MTPALTVTTLFDTRVSGQVRDADSIRSEVEAAEARGLQRIKGRTFACRYVWCGQSRLSLRFRDPHTRRRVNMVFALGEPRLEKAPVNIRPVAPVMVA
jgi:hypothetical protein